MSLLDLLHRWAGGLVGALLVVLAASGTILLWEESWIDLPGADDRLIVEPGAIATGAARAAELGELARITFASEDFGLHQAIYTDGSGAYLNQHGAVVERWTDPLGRSELWLFDLHHHLLAGKTGEIVAGALGLLLVFFALSGAALWWRTRRTFRLRLLPARPTRSAIVRHHRDLGIVAAPLLLLSGITGSLMVFGPASALLLAPWGEASPETPAVAVEPVTPDPDWAALVGASLAAFPDAVPRRLQVPHDGRGAFVMRLRQPFEWTPNGRSYAYLDRANATVVAKLDPRTGDTAQAIQEKFYPLHAGKVGGVLWKLALTFGGVALVLLGLFAMASFWFLRRTPGRRSARVPPPLA